MGSSSSIPSWQMLAHLRKHGQRPAGLVIMTDHDFQRRNLCASGAFAVSFPEVAEAFLVAGLDAVVIANYGEKPVEVAQLLAAANPRYLATYWRGQGLRVVIGEGVCG